MNNLTSHLIILLFMVNAPRAWCEPIFKITSKAQQHGPLLKLKTSLVPGFEVYRKKVINGKTELYKLKVIPQLNIGKERQIEASINQTSIKDFSLKNRLEPIEKKTSPSIYRLGNILVDSYASMPKVVVSPILKKVSLVPEIKEINIPTSAENEIQPAQIQKMNTSDYKILQALIFLEIKHKYEMALGLFADLLGDPIYKDLAVFNYALSAQGLGLNSEYKENIIALALESKSMDWKLKAVNAIIKNANLIQKTDIGRVESLIASIKYGIDLSDDYKILKAKYYSDLGQLDLVDESLLTISASSPQYLESVILKALLSYRQGKVDEATFFLEEAMKLSEKDKGPLRSLTAMTLARIQFQKSQYQEAFQTYLNVEKESSFWLQAMIESSWAQILAGDYEGAAGNMFSLHTDFFKNAFLPESYLVRSVGYLNLCQYGDGAHVLNEMEKKYFPIKIKLEQYRANNLTPNKYYDTVKSWFNNSSFKEVDGLPRSMILELAREPRFLSIQNQINEFEDEISRYNNITRSLIKIERDFLSQKSLAQKEYSEIKRKRTDSPSSLIIENNLQTAEKKLTSFSVQYHIANKVRSSMKNIRSKGIERLEKIKETLRSEANNNLEKNFNQILATINKHLEQNDILKYELYSGAGEHLRFQLAGGEIISKEHNELKVENKKSLNWKFKGEFWEDEVGHYRSSLKNVCPQEPHLAENNK